MNYDNLIEVKVGDTLSIKLKENPSTGSIWDTCIDNEVGPKHNILNVLDQ